MDRLLARQVKRGEAFKSDWISSSDHVTEAGKLDFKRRQEKRMRLAQGKSAEVRTLFPLTEEK